MSALDHARALALLREVFTESLPDRTLPADDAPLLGPGASLDSMELVALVADVEEVVNTRLGVYLVLADDRAMSRKQSPFRDLNALAAYLVERLG